MLGPREIEMPNLTLSSLTQVLINDGRASKNDAEILTRVVEAGQATREELDQAKDLIEKSSLPMGAKKTALAHLESFLDRTAQGLEAELFGAPVGLANRLRFHGIDSRDQLLAKAATPAQRQSLAQQIGTDEKLLRQLAKQADLLRAPN